MYGVVMATHQIVNESEMGAQTQTLYPSIMYYSPEQYTTTIASKVGGLIDGSSPILCIY